MEPIDELLNVRKEKRGLLMEAGIDPYPQERGAFRGSSGLHEEFGELSAEEIEQKNAFVSFAGRIVAFRDFGKSCFLHVQDREGRTQVYARKDTLKSPDYDLFKKFDVGDIVAVDGQVFKTRTGELTIVADHIRLLTKSLRPLPEKWHGLKDVEERYRRRYVDLIVNQKVREVFLRRARIIESLRAFLTDRDFVEVETPMMQPIAGGAVARPFVTHHNTLDMDLYLRIAPELYLKRLVVGGFDRVYEINRNFRNEGLGWRWNPEFTMLEFYQAYTDYQGIMDLTQELITQAAKDVTGGTKTKWGDQEIDWANWQRLTMREAIIYYWPEAAGAKPEMSDFASLDEFVRRLSNAVSSLQTAHDEAPDPLSGEEARGIRRHLSILRTTFGVILKGLETGRSIGKAIAFVFEAVAEEHLTQPTIIYEFPTAVSPLSKQKPDEPEWTERFEIFAGQMEISNGFSELNDPEDQRRRFEEQLKERERGDDEAHQMDEDYIRALSYGMPPAGGCGVGVDRLCMLLTDSHTIRDVILFPLLRPEKNSATGDTEEKK